MMRPGIKTMQEIAECEGIEVDCLVEAAQRQPELRRTPWGQGNPGAYEL
ncbi:hypothetical protein [Arthrobacter sp. MI7-26]|nr:hypothetical protein [Arthrobacter sp. MI7-26]